MWVRPVSCVVCKTGMISFYPVLLLYDGGDAPVINKTPQHAAPTRKTQRDPMRVISLG